jgi:hypothetical protein
MRSDEEIERLLENWLEDEAQPMPRDVLENALESVARSSQDGRRPTGPAWLRSRPMGLLAAAAVLILLVVAGRLAVDRIGSLPPTGSASPGEPQVWDPAADWRSAPNQMNPSADSYGNAGVWSYMRSPSATHDPRGYSLLPEYHVVDQNSQDWFEGAFVNLLVGRAKAQGIISMHPWTASAGVADRLNAILAWRSPYAGVVTITGEISARGEACPDPADGFLFFVDHGPQTLKTVSLVIGESATLDLRATVAPGESLYFILDGKANASCDASMLRVRIAHD